MSGVDPRAVRYVPTQMWILRHARSMTRTAEHIYALLASLYNEELGGAWPRQQWMAEQLDCSTRTVIRGLQELVDLKLIAVVRRGRGQSNFYIFLHHSWMDEYQPSMSHQEVTPMSHQEVTAVVTSKDNLIQTGSTPVLRTGRHALRTAAPPAERSPIRAVADGDFGEVDSPALGGDPDVPEIMEQTTRKRTKRPRPADPADWNAMDLGQYFVAHCGKAATDGTPLMASFVGLGSAKAIAAHARKWMDAGVAPAQIKLDVDHFVGNYRSYRIKGVKPDRAFLAQIAGIREKTLRQSAYDADDAYTMKTQPARRSPYAPA